jgi:hypothetical protein
MVGRRAFQRRALPYANANKAFSLEVRNDREMGDEMVKE